MNILDLFMLAQTDPKDLNNAISRAVVEAYAFSKGNYEDMMDLAADIMAFAIMWGKEKHEFDIDRLFQDFKSKTIKIYDPMKEDFEKFKANKEKLK